MTGRRGARGPAGLVALVAVLAVVIGAVLLLHPPQGSPAGARSADGAATAPAEVPSPRGATGRPGTALALLATLPVKGKAPKTGYARVKDFGAAWLDVDHNGCDTRDDVLRRDLTAITGTRCLVRAGVLRDPYTGRTIHFLRGQRTSTAVQIDHVVALSDAWQTGAQRLSQAQRERLANDPLELLAVDGPTNEAKGDGDAATWLPPNRGFRCAYVARQVAVKAAYRLWVTPAERDAIRRVLVACPAQRVPGEAGVSH